MNTTTKILKFVFLVGILICVAGCNSGGGGGSSAAGSGFTSSDSGSGSDPGTPGDPGVVDRRIHANPEPATLLLFGMGLAGLAVKARKKFKA